MSDGRDEELYADRSFRPGPPPELREPPPRRSRALGVFVATFALAAFAAVVWYAYDQGRQRGSEATAPLIKADPTPTKVRPEQPGGLQVPNQDKLVYDAMRPSDSAAPKVERLLPRPEKPVAPPPPPPPPVPAAPSAEAAVPPPAESAPPAPPPPASDAGIPPARIVTPAPTPQIPVPDATPPVSARVQPDPAPPPAPAVAPAPAPAPVAENPAVQKRDTAAVAPAPAPAPAAASAPVRITPGAFRIQVGALREQAAADAEWARLQKRYPDEIGGLAHRVQKVDLGPGKGVFYRIQSDGVSEATANGICAGLKAKGQPCIVVKP